MKKTFLISALTALLHFSNAQSPAWTWAKGIGGSSTDYGFNVACDAMGNSYVTGGFYSPSINLGSVTLYNYDPTGFTEDFYIIKYDPAGAIIWARTIGGPGNEAASGIAVDASGNVFLSGGFSNDTLKVDGINVLNYDASGMSIDIFIIKLNSSGTAQWAKGFGNARNEQAFKCCTDPAGNVYFAAVYKSSTITIGTNTFTNVQSSGVSYDFLAAKLDAVTGNVVWSVGAGGIYEDYAYDITADASGNAFIAGYYNSPSLTIGSNTITNNVSSGAYSDLFVTKINANGTFGWTQVASGGNNEDEATSIATDGAGNIYVAGIFATSALTIGSTVLTNGGGNLFDPFIFKLDPSSGNVLWAASAGGNGHDFTYSIAADAAGNAYLAGYFVSDSLVFGSYVLKNTAAFSSDGFVVKYSPSGSVIWAQRGGYTDSDNIYSVDVDANNNVTAGGHCFANTKFGNTLITNAGGVDAFIARIDPTVGIENTAENEFISIFPNPSSGLFTCTANSEILKAIITDVYGKVVARFEEKNIGEINLSDQNSGIYIARLYTAKGSYTQKIIKN